MIGGHVAVPRVVKRSDGVVTAVRQVLAYPTGVEIEVEAHARGTSAGDGELLFGVRLADGRHAMQDDEAGLRSGLGPMLLVSGSESCSGGPDDSEDVRLSLWLWPLPPPGPLTVTCSWPRRGLDEVSFVLDADAIREAARQAEPFWTGEF